MAMAAIIKAAVAWPRAAASRPLRLSPTSGGAGR